MWSFIIIHIVASIFIIVIGHYLWHNYIAPTTSTSTTKISQQTQKYKSILSEIQKTQISSPPPPQNYISPEEKQSMMDELKLLLIDETLPVYNLESTRPVTEHV